mmetsp:Transcript_2788/g.3999  ORF Transcript_2788/g.3999 Transcript_2788/m.3999 type:complete len:272 (+) Transcript_2788:77-892(+)
MQAKARLLAAEAQVNTANELIKDYKREDAGLTELHMAMLQQRFDTMDTFIENLRNLCGAYRFATLKSCEFQPIDLYTERENLVPLSSELLTQLKTEQGPMKDNVHKEVVIDDSHSIEWLRTNNTMTWELSLNSSYFYQWANLHITNIQVVLNGAKCGGSNATLCRENGYVVQITHANIMHNRDLNHAEYAFVTPSNDVYHFFLNPSSGKNSTSGDVREEDRVFFFPSPFTQWRFVLVPRYNYGVDLSDVHSVTIKFDLFGQPFQYKKIATP